MRVNTVSHVNNVLIPKTRDADRKRILSIKPDNLRWVILASTADVCNIDQIQQFPTNPDGQGRNFTDGVRAFSGLYLCSSIAAVDGPCLRHRVRRRQCLPND